MADRVFCIDFGSSFTKVALRRDPQADTSLLTYDFKAAGEVEFCVPSLVAVEQQVARNVPRFGHAAMTLRPRSGLYLHANWKKRVFAPNDPPAGPRKPPLDAFLESPELRELAARFGVTAGQVIQLQNMVANARALAGGPAPTAEPEAKNRAVAAPIAQHFFKWLREQVLAACEKLTLDGLDPAAIPARLTVPAFGTEKESVDHPGTQLLLEAMRLVGWRLHPQRPVVTEPYSNVVGVLTGGGNTTQRGKVHLGKMFGKGPLITAMKDSDHYGSYRAVVVDVGAYTTDFATLTLKTEGKTIDDPDAAFAVRQVSVPLGITDLDARVIGALPKDKHDWLTKAVEPIQLEDFRKSVYTQGKPLRTVEVGLIGGAADADAVQAGMSSFVQSVATEAEKFLGGLEPVKLQELVLTGGGAGIPRVREGLITAAYGGGREFVKTYAPGLKRGSVGGPVGSLSEDLARGGSALGGASLYYESDYY